MKQTTTTKQQQQPTEGFAIALTESTDLGMAMLIAEDEEGHYEPIGIAANIGEAREIAASNLRRRMRTLERGGDPGLCPYSYKVWARGVDGDYCLAIDLLASILPSYSPEQRLRSLTRRGK